jgi:hypothetical protein
MTDRLSNLLSEAQSLPDRRRPAWVKYGPIVATLRGKGMGYREIYDWLILRGEALAEKDFSRFRIACSTNQSRALKQAGKAAQKVKGGQS